MRLSEFKDEKAIEVVAALLEPIGKIAKNPKNQESRGEGKTILDFAAAMLKNNPADAKDMLAILADKEPESYHCNAATVFRDILLMLSDPEIMELFGVQSKTPPSSGSVSETTEGQNK
ncbi:hypothetical protein [Acutalibacter muris]|uniref:hypothetical protein n=1 Tax=Acutalibacter muris TaxID=1796620 RepID=UPI00272EE0B5|nr:hypothetical protein [Acutalibacter muris]